MKKKLHHYLFVVTFLAFLTSCSKDTFDEYYGRPENLEPPIFQQLEARGNFKNLTALIDKAGYKDILSKAGYWTMMAPNDEAFTKFFQEKGIPDVSKVDAETASKIVKFGLIYNAFKKDRLADYQSKNGWVPESSFRRRTAYYDGFVTATVDGQPKVIVGMNRNGAAAYVPGDNNNKYVTYFVDKFMTSKKLSASDFNFFFPSVEYTGFNVLGAKVPTKDIVAENGVIHELDKVNMPPLNMEQYLAENPNYSLFRSLIEKNLVSYVFNQPATTTYSNYTGKSDQVFVKVYNSLLSFSPNNENFMKVDDNDGQADAYTMIVPENAPLQEFINTVLLKNFTMETLPQYVYKDLVNAHMVPSAVWPSLKDDYFNALGEELRFNFNSDITDKKVLSNGFFYGANKVQKSNLFYSVFTSAYLDPKYSFATKIFTEGSGYKEMISNINKKFTIFLPSDQVLRGLGFDFDVTRQEWKYVSPVNGASESGSTAKNRLLRLFYSCIVQTPNGELNNIATTSGIIRTGDDELPGEYIKWSNNKVYAAGNIVPGGLAVNVVGKDVQQNGIAYYVDRFPEYSIELPGLPLARLAAANTEYDAFFQYLKNSTIYTAATGKIEGVALGTNYTFIVPNKAAIARAVAAKVLPASTNPTLQGDKDLVADFIRFHIINGKTISSDGKIFGQQETLRKDSKGDKTYVEVTNSPGVLSFKDNSGNNPKANVILATSNNLADRSLIHLVDNYLLP